MVAYINCSPLDTDYQIYLSDLTPLQLRFNAENPETRLLNIKKTIDVKASNRGFPEDHGTHLKNLAVAKEWLNPSLKNKNKEGWPTVECLRVIQVVEETKGDFFKNSSSKRILGIVPISMLVNDSSVWKVNSPNWDRYVTIMSGSGLIAHDEHIKDLMSHGLSQSHVAVLAFCPQRSLFVEEYLPGRDTVHFEHASCLPSFLGRLDVLISLVQSIVDLNKIGYVYWDFRTQEKGIGQWVQVNNSEEARVKLVDLDGSMDFMNWKIPDHPVEICNTKTGIDWCNNRVIRAVMLDNLDFSDKFIAKYPNMTQTLARTFADRYRMLARKFLNENFDQAQYTLEHDITVAKAVLKAFPLFAWRWISKNINVEFFLTNPFLFEIFVKENQDKARQWAQKICNSSSTCDVRFGNWTMPPPSDSIWGEFIKAISRDDLIHFSRKNFTELSQALIRERPDITFEIMRLNSKILKKHFLKAHLGRLDLDLVRLVVWTNPWLSWGFWNTYPEIARQEYEEHPETQLGFLRDFPEFFVDGKPAFESYEKRIRRNWTAELWEGTTLINLFEQAVCQNGLETEFWKEFQSLYSISIQSESSYFALQAHKLGYFIYNFLRPQDIWIAPEHKRQTVEDLLDDICDIRYPIGTDKVLERLQRLKGDSPVIAGEALNMGNESCPEDKRSTLAEILMQTKPWLLHKM